MYVHVVHYLSLVIFHDECSINAVYLVSSLVFCYNLVYKE